MDEAAADQDEYRLIEADKDFHLAIFRASGLDALEQILVRCIMHSHRCKLWAPGHRRSLVDTATRHDVLLERLRARDGEGLAQALGEHIDTLVLLSDPVAGAPEDFPQSCRDRRMSPFVHPEMAVILEEFQAQPAVDLKTHPDRRGSAG